MARFLPPCSFYEAVYDKQLDAYQICWCGTTVAIVSQYESESVPGVMAAAPVLAIALREIHNQSVRALEIYKDSILFGKIHDLALDALHCLPKEEQLLTARGAYTHYEVPRK